jgi:hypothetical protein
MISDEPTALSTHSTYVYMCICVYVYMCICVYVCVCVGFGVCFQSVSDRFELLEDTFAFAFDEKINVSMAMDLFKNLYEETHVSVWTSALSSIQKLDVLLREDVSYGDFRTFFANLTMGALKHRAAMDIRVCNIHLFVSFCRFHPFLLSLTDVLCMFFLNEQTIALLRRMAAYCGNEEAIQETLNVYHQSAVVGKYSELLLCHHSSITHHS